MRLQSSSDETDNNNRCAGYEGRDCDQEIDECLRFEPCERGSCVDGIADYTCECESGWGGKNCSVKLTGCDKVVSFIQ